ncbi:microtubule binding protein [Thelephora terrestris]|uniref:Coronin n=1 Tax=Thelephora terrestris TaxID=56493 RepID=A0A9P6L6L6_9AGAM|nr:microtubule binding protein [Thelephora terrestris]
MSRFVRASKYRHVFGQAAKKEHALDNVKVSGSAWDTNLVAASGSYVSLNWSSSGGGAFAILPLPSPFRTIQVPSKLPDIIPLARSHSGTVLDTAWSPFNDSVVASCGEDGKVMIWKVEASSFEGWGQEHWVPQDFDPVARIDGSARRIGQVLFHPTAEHVLAAASGDHVVKLWDLGNPETPKSVLGGHGDAIQSLTFNAVGNVLVTTCRDRKVRLFDPRSGGDPVRVADGHGGIKGARVVWMGEKDTFATTGFSKMSDRQVAIWDAGSLTTPKMITLDQSSGVVMPFWSDNGILFLAGKGDGNIRYYEYESDSLFALSEHKSSDPQRGMCFLPRRSLEVTECEIARAYKVTASAIEPIAFIVPRKSDSFQSDIYPPAPSSEPSLTAGEFFSGKEPTLKLVSLEDGAVSTSTTAPPKTPAFVESPVLSRSTSLATPVSAAPAPAPAPEVREPISARREPTFSPPPIISLPSPHTTEEVATLRDENSKLNSELREARAQIRNLELQVEAVRANARKAAQLLSSDV